MLQQYMQFGADLRKDLIRYTPVPFLVMPDRIYAEQQILNDNVGSF